MSKVETLSLEQTETQIDDVLELIEEIEVRLLKAEDLYESMTEADRWHHRKIEESIGSEIEKSQRQMADLQREVGEQSKIMNLKSQYEELAKEINQYENPQTTKGKIASVEGETRAFVAKSNSDEINKKHNQLHTLVSMIHDLIGEQESEIPNNEVE